MGNAKGIPTVGYPWARNYSPRPNYVQFLGYAMYVRSCGICHVYGRVLFIFETHLKYFSRLDPLEVPKNMYNIALQQWI